MLGRRRGLMGLVVIRVRSGKLRIGEEERIRTDYACGMEDGLERHVRHAEDDHVLCMPVDDTVHVREALVDLRVDEALDEGLWCVRIGAAGVFDVIFDDFGAAVD